jgi:hypothetical protein
VFDIGDATVASVTNRGTLNLGGTLTTTGGLTNMGTVRGSGAVVGGFTNMNMLDVTGGLAIDAQGGTVANMGTLVVAGGQVLAVSNGDFANSGTLSLGGGARLELAGDFDWTGGALTGGSIVVAGDVVLGGGTSHALDAALQASRLDIGSGETLVLGAGAAIDTADLVVAGTLAGAGRTLATGGDLSISGTVELAGLSLGGDLRVAGGALTAGSTSVSSALIEDGSVVSLGVLTSGGGVVVDGTGTTLSLAGLSASAFDLRGGSRATLGGTATLGADITLDGGATLQLADATVMAGLRIDDGMVTGIGTINGDVFNSGMVSIGNSPGLLVVNGDFTQMADGMLVLEIGGPGSFEAGVNYDQLVVNGTATLAGTLQFVQLDDFVSFADRGELMPLTYTALSGGFASIDLVGDPDFDPEIEFGPTGAIANAVVVPPGDPEENTAEVTQDVAELADQQEELENCGVEEDEAPVEAQVEEGHGVGCRGG